jgi:hypothetical protein
MNNAMELLLRALSVGYRELLLRLGTGSSLVGVTVGRWARELKRNGCCREKTELAK